MANNPDTGGPDPNPDATGFRILHVGCGREPLPTWLPGVETRLDVDPSCDPDIMVSMTNLGDIGVFDDVYCSHALEHLYLHEVRSALREFWRVLVPGGRAIVIVPDLEDVRPTDDVLFVSPGGPISGLDLIYGSAKYADMPHMAHHCGFIAPTLAKAMEDAGFVGVVTKRIPAFNLMGVGLAP